MVIKQYIPKFKYYSIREMLNLQIELNKELEIFLQSIASKNSDTTNPFHNDIDKVEIYCRIRKINQQIQQAKNQYLQQLSK